MRLSPISVYHLARHNIRAAFDWYEWCSQRQSSLNTYTVYPKKYAHGFCFAVLCCGYTLTDFPISIRLTSLALWQSNDCPSASKATLMNMDKYFMWNQYDRLHNHNKAQHNKTVCIFLGIYYIMQITPWNILLPSPSMFQGLTIYSNTNCPWSANSSLNYRFSFLPLSIEYLLKELLRMEKNILCQCTKVKFYRIVLCNYLWCSTGWRPDIYCVSSCMLYLCRW